MNQLYNIVVCRLNGDVDSEDRETIRQYFASSLGEALTMAERDDTGKRNHVYGILPSDYVLARQEGIEFNDADGLLL